MSEQKSVTRELWDLQDMISEAHLLLNHAGVKGDTLLIRIHNLIEQRDRLLKD